MFSKKRLATLHTQDTFLERLASLHHWLVDCVAIATIHNTDFRLLCHLGPEGPFQSSQIFLINRLRLLVSYGCRTIEDST